MEFLLESFDRLGYSVTQQAVLAADYGVPQRRQRLIIVGSLEGATGTARADIHRSARAPGMGPRGAQLHVTTGDVIGDLEDRDDLAEPEEVVAGKYGHLLPDIPPGDNYLFYTAKRGHPKPLFGWRKRYWSFLLKLDPEPALADYPGSARPVCRPVPLGQPPAATPRDQAASDVPRRLRFLWQPPFGPASIGQRRAAAVGTAYSRGPRRGTVPRGTV